MDGKKLRVTSPVRGREVIRADTASAGSGATVDVLGKRIFPGDAVRADDAGNRVGAGEALLLDQEFKRSVTAPSGGNLKHPSLCAIGIEVLCGIFGSAIAAFKPFANQGVHVIDVRWGKITAIPIYCDTDFLQGVLGRNAARGIAEASAEPICD